MIDTNQYREFLKSKIKLAEEEGIKVSIDATNPALKPHQADLVKWLVNGG